MSWDGPPDALGSVKRWMDGDIYMAKNDFCSLAWAVTDDPAKVGSFGWHGPQQIGVEYVSADWVKRHGHLWSGS